MKLPVGEVVEALGSICLINARAGITPSEFVKVARVGDRITFALAAEVYGVTFANATEPDTGKDWVAYIDRASFVPFVNAARELRSKAAFEFVMLKGGVLLVKQGRRKATFSKIDEIKGYTETANFKGKTLKLTSVQKGILQIASRYATSDPTIAHLNCVMLLKSRAALASNDVAIAMIEDSIIPITVPLPVQLISSIDTPLARRLTVKNNFAKLTLTNGWLCQTPNAKAVTAFPTKQILAAFESAAQYKKRFTMDGGMLLSTLKRLEAYIALVVKRDLLVQVTGAVGDKRVVFSCQAPQGLFQENLAVTKPLRRAVECTWLMSHLLPLAEVSSTLGDIHVHYEDAEGKTPFYFRSKHIRLLISKFSKK